MANDWNTPAIAGLAVAAAGVVLQILAAILPPQWIVMFVTLVGIFITNKISCSVVMPVIC